MGHSILRSALLGGVALASLAASFGVARAEAEPSTTAISEVIVTAQRRAENLQETPVAVTALSKTELEQANITSTRDLMTVTPSLQVNSQANGDSGLSTFFLRGMGQLGASNGAEPAVGVYIDDVYYPSIQGSQFSIVDLDQVEVLRGPQGTLFGRNTIAGAIRYTTTKPSNDFNGHISADAGSFGGYDYTGAINIPIGDKLAVRVSAGDLYKGGFVREQNGGGEAGGSQSQLYRVAVRAKPTDKLTVDLEYQDAFTRTFGVPYYLPGPITAVTGAATGLWNVFAAKNGLPLYNNQFISQCHYCEAGTTTPEFSKDKIQDGSATINWALNGDLSVKSLTAWQSIKAHASGDIDGTPIVADANTQESVEALSQEFQFNDSAFDGRLKTVGGVFLYKQNYDSGGVPTAPNLRNNAALAQSNNINRETKSSAIYIDGSFDLTSKFSLLGGARTSKDDKSVSQTVPSTGAVVDSISGSFASTTGRVGGRYKWTDDVMTYGTISTGFRGGGFNCVTICFGFQPETDITYEIGARTEFFDHRLRINPTVFYTTWDKIQVQALVVSNGVSALAFQNAGAAKAYGFELEGVLQVTPEFRLSGNLATLNIRYTDIGKATGITVNSHFMRAPDLTGGLSGDYHKVFANDWGVNLSVNYSYEGDQYSTATDADQLLMPAYSLIGARASLTDPSKHWMLSLYGTNLTDKFYFQGGTNFTPSGTGTIHYNQGRPREIGASLKYQY